MCGRHITSVPMQQIAFPSLPLINSYKRTVDVHTNIFTEYFRKAYFVPSEEKPQQITNVFKLYDVFNYLLLQYDSTSN